MWPQGMILGKNARKLHTAQNRGVMEHMSYHLVNVNSITMTLNISE